jgi:hypothetical protein
MILDGVQTFADMKGNMGGRLVKRERWAQSLTTLIFLHEYITVKAIELFSIHVH